MKEEQETAKDENKESLETQETERNEGTEEHDEHVISEEFQHEVMSLVDEYKDSMPCLKYMSDRCYEAQDDLRRREEAKKNKGKNKTPSEYSTAEMPS